MRWLRSVVATCVQHQNLIEETIEKYHASVDARKTNDGGGEFNSLFK